jgi:cephalosporin hydroxylase
MSAPQSTSAAARALKIDEPIASPATALWRQRDRIARLRERFGMYLAIAGHPNDLFLYQYAQIAAFALEFQPDLIIELGRAFGNSTCCLLEVANQIGGRPFSRVLSLCLTDYWFSQTAPRLKQVLPESWFQAGDILEADILEYDFSAALSGVRRCLVFWDAHGFEVAECVLGNLLPLLNGKPHVIVMHDLSDHRHEEAPRAYGSLGLWKGENAAASSFRLGHVSSRVAQAISVLDFVSRNNMSLHSAAESLHAEVAGDPAKLAALSRALGPDLFSLQAHWFWFSLSETPGPLTFPAFKCSPDATRKGELPAQAQEVCAILKSVENMLRNDGPHAPQVGARQGLLTELEVLADALGTYERLLGTLAEENKKLTARLDAELSSFGGRVLGTCRKALQAVAPVDSWRRRLYNLIVDNPRGHP